MAAEEKRQLNLRVEGVPGEVALTEAYRIDAVAELVGNAFGFSRPSQPVIVSGWRVGGEYWIEMLDDGQGMTSAQRASVGAFTQFERARREQQGVG